MISSIHDDMYVMFDKNRNCIENNKTFMSDMIHYDMYVIYKKKIGIIVKSNITYIPTSIHDNM